MDTNHALELTADNFENEMASGLILVDFWAPWCGPCKVMLPVIEALAGEMAGKARIAKVNVDDNQELAARYGVMTIPSIFIIKDGDVVKQFVGVQSKELLKTTLNAYIEA